VVCCSRRVGRPSVMTMAKIFSHELVIGLCGADDAGETVVPAVFRLYLRIRAELVAPACEVAADVDQRPRTEAWRRSPGSSPPG